MTENNSSRFFLDTRYDPNVSGIGKQQGVAMMDIWKRNVRKQAVNNLPLLNFSLGIASCNGNMIACDQHR